MTPLRPTGDLAVVLRVADVLEGARLRTWLFGGWAEELTGLSAPREHAGIDLLYPGRSFDRVDRFLERAAVGEIAAKRESHRRVFILEGAQVELLLVQRDEHGWHTDFPAGRHSWPDDVFAGGGRLPVASEAALSGYRARLAVRSARRAA